MNSQFADLMEFRSGDDRPEWAKDCVTTRTTVSLHWKDRLRVLFGWVLEVEVATATANVVGRTESRSCAHVSNPRRVVGPLRRRPGWESNGRKTGDTMPAESARRAEKAAHWHLLLSPTGQYVAVFNLKQFCEANGLDANTLSAQSRGGLCSQGWFVTSDAFPVPRKKQKPGPKPGPRPVLAYRKGTGT